MKNIKIAEIFSRIADILEIKDENPFKIRAYRRASLTLESVKEEFLETDDERKIQELPGIGKDLSLKIKEYVATGKISYYKKILKEIDPGLIEMLNIPGVGPKTIQAIHKKLKIKNISQLQKAAQKGNLRALPGFKEKTEDNILKGIEFFRKSAEHIPLYKALELSQEITFYLKQKLKLKQIEAAGSVRRRKETIKDIDIVIGAEEPKDIIDIFTQMPQIEQVLSKGKTKSSILTNSNIQVDIRVVKPNEFGAALAYFTGSMAHNIHLRKIARDKKFKINEYGIFDLKPNKKIAGKKEIEIYKILGLPFIPPEIREDRGEIEAGFNAQIPLLVEDDDIKGDLHLHSSWSDGENSIEEMAERCISKGYKYMAVTDHSSLLQIANGLSEDDLKKQWDQISKLNLKFRNFKILKGVEVEIKGDGTLDLKRNTLKQADIVIGAIHSGFKQNKKTLTKRFSKAMDTGLIDIIAHPTGKLLGKREAYELYWEKIFNKAKETHTALEINASPLRLDLNDINCRSAKEAGVKIAINTDSHNLSQLDNISFGVSIARRGWLEKNDIINCKKIKIGS
jgi:DNA polymerase (family 10)